MTTAAASIWSGRPAGGDFSGHAIEVRVPPGDFQPLFSVGPTARSAGVWLGPDVPELEDVELRGHEMLAQVRRESQLPVREHTLSKRARAASVFGAFQCTTRPMWRRLRGRAGLQARTFLGGNVRVEAFEEDVRLAGSLVSAFLGRRARGRARAVATSTNIAARQIARSGGPSDLRLRRPPV